jgi:hypothetical protein
MTKRLALPLLLEDRNWSILVRRRDNGELGPLSHYGITYKYRHTDLVFPYDSKIKQLASPGLMQDNNIIVFFELVFENKQFSNGLSNLITSVYHGNSSYELRLVLRFKSVSDALLFKLSN